MQFSTDYLTQLFQRITQADSPKFFNILTKAFLVVGAALGLVTYTETYFTTLHQPIPGWLTMLDYVLKGILGLSGIVTAQATIKTPDTPPLASEIEKPTLESQAKQIADLQATVSQLLATKPTTEPTTES